MNAMAALRQYQTVNTQAQVTDASPHRLIQMLMEGGLSRLAQAKGAMLHGQSAQKGELISKAIGIIGGLREGSVIALPIRDRVRVFRIVDLPPRRVPPREARHCYEELPD